MRLPGTLLLAALALGCGGTQLPFNESSSKFPSEKSDGKSGGTAATASTAEAESESPFDRYPDYMTRVETFAKYLFATNFTVGNERAIPIRWFNYAHPLRTLERDDRGTLVRAGYQIHLDLFPEGLSFWVQTDIPKDDADAVFMNTMPPINAITPELQRDLAAAMRQARKFAWAKVPEGDYTPSFVSETFSFETDEGIYYARVFVNEEADGKGNVTDAFGGVRGAFVPHFLGKRTPEEVDGLLR